MQHFKLRCKHCHTEYTYCTHGNGSEYGTEEGCSKEYCARCQKAIDNALAKIPVECQPKYMEIHDSRIFEMFERVKKNYKESVEENPINGLFFDFENSPSFNAFSFNLSKASFKCLKFIYITSIY